MRLSQYKYVLAVLTLTACGKASFDPYMSGLHENPSPQNSSMKISDNNVADGMTPAIVTLEIRSASDLPLAGITMQLSVTGNNNVIVPCTTTDANGLASCKVYTTTAEQKDVTASGMINLKGQTAFIRPRFTRTVMSVVGGTSMIELQSGHKVFTAAGIVESPAAQKDSNGIYRVYTSVLSSVIGDE